MKEIKEEYWVPAKFITESGDIIDFTGLYEVSDLGRIKSLNYRRTGKARVLSHGTRECKDKDGIIFYHVMLRKDNKRYMLTVHRLVLSSFREHDYFPRAVCDHIDARTSTSCDNRLCNLRWVSPSQNTSTEHRKTLASKALTNHPTLSKRVRVTDLTTGESTEFPSAREAGRSLGINPKTPAGCIKQYNGFCKKLGLHFAYV